MINNIFKYGYNFFQNNDNLVKIYSTIKQNICRKKSNLQRFCPVSDDGHDDDRNRSS